METLGTDTGLSERVLAQPDGERLLTDLRHVAQRLHAVMTSEAARRGRPAGVAGRGDRGRDHRGQHRGSAPARHRRGGRPGAHPAPQQGSPVPDRLPPRGVGLLRARRRARRRAATARRRDGGAGRRRAAGSGPAGALASVAGRGGRRAPAPLLRRDDARSVPGGDLVGRLAQHHDLRPAPLLGSVGAIGEPDASYPATCGPGDETIPRSVPAARRDVESLREIESLLAVEPVQQRPPVRRPSESAVAPSLEARRFTRMLDTVWRRTSYSSLTAAAHGLVPAAGVSSEPEPVKEDDESAAVLSTPEFERWVTPPAMASAVADLPSPMRAPAQRRRLRYRGARRPGGVRPDHR